jgi:hypothetical protein
MISPLRPENIPIPASNIISNRGFVIGELKAGGEISLLGLGVLPDFESEFGWEVGEPGEGCDATRTRSVRM